MNRVNRKMFLLALFTFSGVVLSDPDSNVRESPLPVGSDA